MFKGYFQRGSLFIIYFKYLKKNRLLIKIKTIPL